MGTHSVLEDFVIPILDPHLLLPKTLFYLSKQGHHPLRVLHKCLSSKLMIYHLRPPPPPSKVLSNHLILTLTPPPKMTPFDQRWPISTQQPILHKKKNIFLCQNPYDSLGNKSYPNSPDKSFSPLHHPKGSFFGQTKDYLATPFGILKKDRKKLGKEVKTKLIKHNLSTNNKVLNFQGASFFLNLSITGFHVVSFLGLAVICIPKHMKKMEEYCN